MKQIAIVIVLAAFASLTHAQEVESPLRTALGLSADSVHALSDEDILGAVQLAVDQREMPASSVQLHPSNDGLNVRVIRTNDTNQYICTFNTGEPLCTDLPLTTQINYEVDVPVKPKMEEGGGMMTSAGYLAAMMVTAYGIKKIMNRKFLGRYGAADDEDEESMFPTRDEMLDEIQHNRKVTSQVVRKLATEVDGQILRIVQPLSAVATCGHHHGHGSAHGHIGCEDVTPEVSATARKGLFATLKKFVTGFSGLPDLARAEAKYIASNYQSRVQTSGSPLAAIGGLPKSLAVDFYNEAVHPFVELSKATVDPEKRRQAIVFADLILRRMVLEQGLPAAVLSASLVAISQAAYETAEHYVLPNHMFCHVGNALILSAVFYSYTTYFCMTRFSELSGTPLGERWRIARRVAHLRKPHAHPQDDTERMVRALHMLFRLVERDVRHARNLDNLSAGESRPLAHELGKIRRDLTLLSIRALNHKLSDDEVLHWMTRLYGVQSKAYESTLCDKVLTGAA